MTVILIFILASAGLAWLPARALTERRVEAVGSGAVLLRATISFAGSLGGAGLIFLAAQLCRSVDPVGNLSPLVRAWLLVLAVACLFVLPLLFADAFRADWFGRPRRDTIRIELMVVAGLALASGLAVLALVGGQDPVSAAVVAGAALPLWVFWRVYVWMMLATSLE